MNPQNFQNPIDPMFQPNPSYQNYTPYLKQPLPPKPLDKRNITLPINDLLRQNIGSVIATSYQDMLYKGVLEYVSDSYLVIHDPKSHTHTILFLKDIHSITFEDDINFLPK